MKNFLSVKFILIVFSFFIFAAGALAQEKESPEKYGITFPISELGSCKDLAECKTYCDDPVNRSACISFAKQKGFYKEKKNDELITKAKSELGCDSEASCRALCEQAENKDKCASFAGKHGLGGPPPGKNPEILEKAKSTLGCDSPETCKTVCSQEENREKCSQFAQSHGLKGGVQYKGPGGCTSEETCKAFCSDPSNFSLCSSFGSSVGREFKGPGGCTDETSCKSYCQQNPGNCRDFGQSQGQGQERSAEALQNRCNNTPNCSWTDNTCKCNHNPEAAKEYENVCKENPDKCRQFQQNNQSSGKLDDSATGGDRRKEAEERRKQEMEKRRQEQQNQQGSQQLPSQNYTPPADTYRPPADSGGSYTQPSGGTYTSPPPPAETTNLETKPLDSTTIRGASQESSWFSNLLQRLFGN